MRRLTGRAGLARATLALLIVPLAAYVVVSVVRGRLRQTSVTPPSAQEPSLPPGGASEMKAFTFQQTREGRLLYRLRARQMVGSEAGAVLLDGIEPLEIFRPGGTISVRADHARILQADSGLSSLDLDGSVHAETVSGDRFEAPRAHLDAPNSTVTSRGPVRFRAGGIEGEGSTLEYNTDSGRLLLGGPVSLTLQDGPLAGWTASAETLTREGADSPVVLTGGVRFVRPIAGAAAPEWIECRRARVGPGATLENAGFEGPVRGSLAASTGPVAFAAERMDVSRPKPPAPSLALLRGQASLARTLADGQSQKLSAPEIDVFFDAKAEPERTEARPQAVLNESGPQGDGEVRSRLITLALGADAVHSGHADGDVRIERTPADGSGPVQAGGEQAELASEEIQLRGGRPWVRTEGRFVEAEQIDFAGGRGPVRARGRVHVRLDPARREAGDPQPSDSAPPLPLFSSQRTVFVDAPEAEFLREPEEVARFRGGTRAWQDDASLQSASLDYSDAAGTAHAWGGTITRGLRRPGAGPPVPITVTAPEMYAEQKSGLVRYLGGALYSEPSGTLRAREIHVFRTVGGGSKAAEVVPVAGAAGTPPSPRAGDASGIERVEAIGDVSFVSGTRRGRAEEAEQRPAENLLILRGGTRPAVFEDPPTARRFEGPALTLDLAADTISVGGTTDRARVRFAPEQPPGKR